MEVSRAPVSLPLVNYCVLQFPINFSVNANATTQLIFGQIYHDSVTPDTGSDARVFASLGYGPANTNPITHPNDWIFTPTTYNTSYGNNDEYMATVTAPSIPGTYRFVYRFSINGIASKTYCDSDGNGSNPGLSFGDDKMGTMRGN
ncbi:hypothetical protein AB3N60_14180 [Leptospira sp. WS39.C2]